MKTKHAYHEQDLILNADKIYLKMQKQVRNNFIHFFILLFSLWDVLTTFLQIKIYQSNLSKEWKGLYTENYKTSRKDIKQDTNKWKDILCSWIRRLSTKMSYRFNATPIEIHKHFFTEI